MKKIVLVVFSLFCLGIQVAESQNITNFSQENAVQNWTVPCGVTQITVTVAGAAGGGSFNLPDDDIENVSNGASLTGICTVTPGDKLSIVVGAAGDNGVSGAEDDWGGGGGGGSFVYDSNTLNLLIVGGGGGGATPVNTSGGAGGTNIITNATTIPSFGTCATGGTGGNGGNAGNAAGGAGWISNGDSAIGPPRCTGGNDRANFFTGGLGIHGLGDGWITNYGGYGGGGGSGGGGGGGGGGYNGGGGGAPTFIGGGGGGGSYLNGTLVGTPIANNTGNGYVTIICSSTLLSCSLTVTQNVTCHGGSNGGISSTVSGGETPYTYLWSNAETTTSISSLSAGTYTLSVNDACGATATASATITQPLILSVSANTTANELCNGGSNGSASSTVSGGTSSYTYLWSNAETTVSISSLSAGTYTLSVNDACGATATASATITQPLILSVSANTTANELCNGGSNGSVSSSVSGGTLPYTYLWSNAETTVSISSLSAGTYTLTVTDNNGCTGSATATITQPNILNVSANTTANELCNGGSNGSASSSVSGGTTPYTYLWSNGETTTNDNNLTAGTYTLIVHDNNGCTGTASVAITQPNILNVSANNTSNVLCNGGNTGSASSTVSGGTLPYTYLWSNGETTTNDNNLSAGTYTLTVHDNNGCTGTASVAITQPTLLIAVIDSVTNVSCNGDCNGKANSMAYGGTPPYTYSMEHSGPDNISGLCAGVYTYTVTDANGCIATTSVTITQPPALIVSANTTANVSCNGGSNGSASSIVSGGTSPYTYLWSNAETTTSISNLSAGTYTLTVHDNNGCTGTASATITQPNILNVSANTIANVLCNGESNGSASLTVSGGTSPYTYLWSNAETTTSISSLSSGTYTVTVHDSCGNSATASVIISQPTPILMLVDAYGFSDTACHGVIFVSASGGAGPFNYRWSSGQTTDTAKGLCDGYYCCYVTDRNGCVDSACVQLPTTGINNIIPAAGEIIIYPNPNKGVFTVAAKSEELSAKSNMEVYNMLGEKIYSNLLTIYNSQFTINLSNQPNGIYLYRLMDIDGNLLGEGKLIIQK